jgi:hypothetical protein
LFPCWLGIFVQTVMRISICRLTQYERSYLPSYSREYWTIYGGPGFLAVIWFGSTPTLSPLPTSVSWVGETHEVCDRESTCWRERGEGTESYDPKKAWPSIKHSILSAQILLWGVVHVFSPSQWCSPWPQNQLIGEHSWHRLRLHTYVSKKRSIMSFLCVYFYVYFSRIK